MPLDSFSARSFNLLIIPKNHYSYHSEKNNKAAKTKLTFLAVEKFDFKTVNSKLWTIMSFHINDSKKIARDNFIFVVL